EVAAPFDLAIGPYRANGGLGRIIRLWRLLRHRPRRGLVEARGRSLAEGFVRPLLVVVARKGLETALLSGAIGRGRPHRLQKREMKALVPSILLGMARIDSLMPDAELDPPSRQFGQARRSRRSEGRAIVGADHLGKAVVAKRPLHHRPRLALRRP